MTSILALGAGILGAAAMPPLGAVYLLVPAFSGLMLLIQRSPSVRAAASAGGWFGFGYHLAGLHWIANALLIDPERHAWLIPVALLSLPGLLAIYAALAAGITRAITGGRSTRVYVFASAWTVMEWLRAHLFTGFPWNLAGYAWADFDGMMQSVALVGIHGLGLITVLAAASPVVLFCRNRPTTNTRAALGAAWMLLAALWIAGQWRLVAAPPPALTAVRLRLVQPNIAQNEKWEADRIEGNFRTLLEMSRRPAAVPPDVILWPEAAVAFSPDLDQVRRRQMAAVVSARGILVTGAIRESGPDAIFKFVWNSIFAIDSAATVVDYYDKAHLVPFGEYMPLRRWLPLDPIAAGPVDFAQGPGPHSLKLANFPSAAPLVCYEAIFPGSVIGPGERPRWLLNLTNDAWFGRSAGPRQHFAIARTRAIEEGLPLVRVANSGISAVVDPYGRSIARLDLGERGVIDAALPAALNEVPPYARFGDGVALVMLILVLGVGRLSGWMEPLHRYT